MIRIRADNELFIISEKTIEKQPNSSLCLALLIDNPDNLPDLIIKKEIDKDVTTIYVDADQNIMKQLIRKLRGGEIEKNFDDNEFLKNTSNQLGFSFYKENTIETLNETKKTQENKAVEEQPVNPKENIFETVAEIIKDDRQNDKEMQQGGGFNDLFSERYVMDTERQNDISKMFERNKLNSKIETDDFSLFSSDIMSIINQSKKKSKKTKSKILSLDTDVDN